jgi:hypothetical protein
LSVTRHRTTRGDLPVVRSRPDGSTDLGPSRGDPFGDDPFAGDAFDRTMTDLFRQNQRVMDDSFRAMEKSIAGADELTRRMEEDAGSTIGGPGPRTYRREERSEKALPGGGYSKYYYSESVTTFGGPVPFFGNPFAGTSLFGTLALCAGIAAYYKYTKKFLAGFQRTTYRTGLPKLLMAIAWPALWAMNTRGFRDEFGKAINEVQNGVSGGGPGRSGADADATLIDAESSDATGDGDRDGPRARV